MSNYLYILIALIHPFSEFRVSVTQPRFTLRVLYFFLRNARFSHDLLALCAADDATDPDELRKICQRGSGALGLGCVPRAVGLAGMLRRAAASGNLNMKNLAVC